MLLTEKQYRQKLKSENSNLFLEKEKLNHGSSAFDIKYFKECKRLR